MSELPTRTNLAVGPQPLIPISPQIPPLRLYHFFALTAVAALLLTQMRPAFATSSPMESRLPYVFGILGALYSLCVSFAITATAFGLVWRWQGLSYPFHPGHWLLLAVAASYVIMTIVGLLLESFTAGLYWLLGGIGALLDIYIGIKQCRERRWSWVFYLKGFAATVPILGDMMLLVIISRAGLTDRNHRIARDWLHRAGVLIQILGSLLIVGIFVSMMLAFTMHFS
jgi:hypothetical protein